MVEKFAELIFGGDLFGKGLPRRRPPPPPPRTFQLGTQTLRLLTTTATSHRSHSTMSSAKHWEQDKDATLYVGNLDERAKEELIFELFSQVGRVSTVHAPLDRVSRTHQGYAFVEFITAEDADYAAKVMNGIKLYGRPLKVNKSNADKEKQADIGAELFIGNLDSVVDEKMLYDTFSRFGTLISNPKVRILIRIEHNPSAKICPDCTRRGQPLQGLWLHLIRQFRSIRQGHRNHARQPLHEQGDHSHIRIQERRQRRAPR